MSPPAEDDVVVDDDSKGFEHRDHVARHAHIGRRGGRVARGMVVGNPTAFDIYLIFIVFSGGRLKVVPGLGSGV